jgi:hypothetical protein
MESAAGECFTPNSLTVIESKNTGSNIWLMSPFPAAKKGDSDEG